MSKTLIADSRSEPTVTQWDAFFSRLYWLFIRGAPSKKRCKQVFTALQFPKKYHIIEMGCGTGHFLRWFKEQGYIHVTGLDYSQNLLAKLKPTGITTICADAKHTKLKSHSYDVIFSDGVVEHFENPLPYLSEFARLTRDYLITIVPRPTFQNRINTAIMQPPTEFNRQTQDWIMLHSNLGFKYITYKILGGNCLMVICRKKEPIASLYECSPH